MRVKELMIKIINFFILTITKLSDLISLKDRNSKYDGRFYVRRVVDLMKTAKVNACIIYIFLKLEFLSIHAT